MKSNLVRKSFLDFFEKRGLPVVKSSSLIPEGDPTLLFTSAGMVQFKPYYLGLKTDKKRACSCQKCFRTTDIDNVGKTIRHLTFFEMLGNFSFGDYFKTESLNWGWEYLTKVLGLPADRFYVSVYGGGSAPRDEDAVDIWKKILPAEARGHILELGDKDNFWTMGDTGPCGPCSEIYWDRGEQYAHPGCLGPGKCDCDRYVEIWNHVFTQFDRRADGTYKTLPKKNIDTGMGLERLCLIMEGKESPFETSLFMPVIGAASDLLNIPYDRDGETTSAFRIIGEHVRAACFLISEGIIPSNEGRGYILRRLIRRASRYGKLLGADEPFLHKLVNNVFEIYNGHYPEIVSAEKQIKNTLRFEEQGFIETLQTGEKYLSDLLGKYPNGIPGAEAFSLYETYGFPLELTCEIAGKKGISVDAEGFEKARVEAQKLAKSGWKSSGEMNAFIFQTAEQRLPDTVFTGYDNTVYNTEITALLTEEGKTTDSVPAGGHGYAVLKETPFYAQCGGQVGDTGKLYSGNGIAAEVLDTQKPVGRVYYHKIKALKELKTGDKIRAEVSEKRYSTTCNHSAIHVINAALKQVFGETTRQAGSEVDASRFRFDYTINRAPTKQELDEVEKIANEAVAACYKVTKEERPLKDAQTFGATTLLGEKYQDPARFVLINKNGFASPEDRYSLELCGGTHVDNTGELITVKILRESSVSRGVRRIEGVAGPAAIKYLSELASLTERLCTKLSVPAEELEERIDKLTEQVKELRNAREKQAGASGETSVLPLKDNIKLVLSEAKNAAVPALRGLADKLKEKYSEKSVLFLYSVNDGKMSFVATRTKDMEKSGFNASAFVKELASACKGSGGGRPDFAQGGIPAVSDKNSLLKKVKELVSGHI